MKNFIGEGAVITVVAASDVTSGDVYDGGDGGIGVYHHDALTGESVSVAIEGQFELPKGAQTWSALDELHWSAGQLNNTGTGTPAGKAGEDRDSGDALATVKIG